MDEQDQILGRLVRERKECRVRIAALRAKASEMAKDLAAAAGSLRVLFDQKAGYPSVSARNCAEAIPSREEVMSLVREAAAEQERLSEIEKHLAGFDL